MSRWDELKCASAAHNERGDCGVRALAVATGLSYELCHKALKAAGRTPRSGTWEFQMERAIEMLGFTYKIRRVPCKTMTKVADHCRMGVGAIISVTRHYAGWDGEKVVDWSAGSRKRVQHIIDVFEESS